MPSSKSETSGRSRQKKIDSALGDLIDISRAIGSDPDLVQGGGGNTSVKSDDGRRMFVKASGTALANMSPSAGWAEVDLNRTLAILEDESFGSLSSESREAAVLSRLDTAVLSPRGARPSVETCIHALLDRVVIHTHPIGLNALLCSRDSREIWRDELSGLAREPLYIPYVDPGYTLALRVQKEIEAYGETYGRLPNVLLLENHGLFVSAENLKKCQTLSTKFTSAGNKWIGGARVNPKRHSFVRTESSKDLAKSSRNGSKPAPPREILVRGALLQAGCEPVLIRRDDSAIAGEFISSTDALALSKRGAFTPDQIVYCRTRPLVLAGAPSTWVAKALSYREKHGVDPRVVIVKGDGVYYAAPDLAQIKVVAETYRSAMVTILRSSAAGGPRILSRSQAEFIESWEVEVYRAKLLSGSSRSLTGRVAVITGAGSGLGKGIALQVIGAGGTVIALDIDRSGLDEVAATQPEGRYLPLRCDVTDEASVQEAFRSTVASAGGVDILVNAAGIAPSFPLVDFPLGAWSKTLEINLTGYFLTARESARLLIAQGAGGNIINLTSKSGLDASKANSAYNATKAGEIHLMRGWALELGSAGIRVNCVAPGNVFKGSKIWNEEYIKICARKKGIRPEEVIPYYTSLSPLGKEIEPLDIANAILFLVSDEARNITGQTLVVDGGQVMVR